MAGTIRMALAGAIIAASCVAATAQTVRVRGTVDKVDGNVLTWLLGRTPTSYEHFVRREWGATR